MDFQERLGWLVLGCLIGFVLGYIVRSLHNIEQKVEHVEETVASRTKDEKGFMRVPIVADIMLAVVVILVAYAAFSSQSASNDVKDTQSQLSRVSNCTQQYLSRTILALNERTTYTQDRANSNVELQKAQAVFLSVALENPPPSDTRLKTSLEKYFETLTTFVEASAEANTNLSQNPYPTNEELINCIDPQS